MRSLSLLLLALLFASCAKQKEEAHSLVHKIPVESFQAALQMADAAKLKCADSAACPENVGIFVGASSGSVSTCTAFLIAKDIVATNSHCIPSAVKLMPNLCAERVRIVLPKSGEHQEESFACETLLGQSERPNEISPDLALFRVKKTDRSALPIDRGGVKPNSIHQAYKMNPAAGASGTLVAQSCLSVPNSYRFSLYRNETDSVFVTADCPSVPGNSGAPIVNSEGQAVGIFQAELALDEDQKNSWGPYLKEGENFAPLAIGTSLRCLKKLESWEWNEDCAPIDPEEIGHLDPEHAPGIQARLEEIAAAQEDNIFRWQPIATKTRVYETHYTLFPACFKPLHSWGWRHKNPNGEYVEEAVLPAAISPILVKTEFNRYMQYEVKVSLRATAGFPVTFSPKELASDGISTLVNVDDRGGQVPFCRETE